MTTLRDLVKEKELERQSESEAAIVRDREKHLAEAAQRKLREEGTSVVDVLRRTIPGGGSGESAG